MKPIKPSRFLSILTIGSLGLSPGFTFAAVDVLKCLKKDGQIYFADDCGSDAVADKVVLKRMTRLDPPHQDPIKGLVGYYERVYPRLTAELRGLIRRLSF